MARPHLPAHMIYGKAYEPNPGFPLASIYLNFFNGPGVLDNAQVNFIVALWIANLGRILGKNIVP